MRITNQYIVIFLLFFSFFSITLYWIFSAITFNDNEERIDQKLAYLNPPRQNVPEKLADREDFSSQNLEIRSNFKKALQSYAAIAVKINNKGSFSTKLACASEIFVIECDNPGLAAMLLMTLDHLSTCREIGGIPTVFWRNCGTVCPSDATINSWNLFFEPVNPNIELKANKVFCFLKSFGPNILTLQPAGTKIRESNYTYFTELLNLSFKKRNIQGFRSEDLITSEVRFWANDLIQQYVKVNTEIQEIVDKFYKEHFFGYTVLAVHVRGTDHALETQDGKLPPLISWIQNAKYIFQSLPSTSKIFIAGDNNESIEKFISEFGQKVIFTKALRAVKYHGKEVHSSNYDPYKLGVEVLIDILLMAKADHFLHAESSVAALVTYFNPSLHTHFLASHDYNGNKVNDEKHLQFGYTEGLYVKKGNVKNDGYSDTSQVLEIGDEELFQCYLKNNQYSFCPDTRKGIFLDPKNLQTRT